MISLSVISQDAISQTAYSSSKKFTSNWFINASAGTSQFYGDMSNENPFQKLKTDTRIGVALSAGKMFWPFLGVRGQVYYGMLKSTRHDLKQYYESKDVLEANISLIVNFADMILGYKQDRFFTIYGTLGMGLANWQSKRYDLNTNKLIASNGYSGNGPGKMTTEFVLPAGVGLNFRLNKHWSSTVENTWHIVNSDILDTKKGGFKYDVFIYTSVGFTYKFNLVKERKEIEPESAVIIPVIKHEEEKVEEVIADPVIEELPDPVAIEEKPEIIEEVVIAPVVIPPSSDAVEYRVQVRARFERALTAEELGELNLSDYEIQENQGRNGWYRYSVGSFDNWEDAEELKEVIRNSYGITDAFVVAYKDNVRINMTNTNPPLNNFQPNNYQPGKTYRIQILCVTKNQPEKLSDFKQKYNITEDIYQLEEDGLYKYLTTEYTSWQQAAEARQTLIDKGVSDAFIATYVNGVRE